MCSHAHSIDCDFVFTHEAIKEHIGGGMDWNKSELAKNSLEFNQAYKPCIDEMLCLLSNDFPINFIGYLRIYPNGKALAFSNNLKWQKYFFETVDGNSKSFEKATLWVHSKKSPYVYIWPENLADKTLGALHAHNIWNGMSIYRHAGEYIDSWSFAGNTQEDMLYTLFIKYTDMFEKFIKYVEKKYSFLFAKQDSILFNFSAKGFSEEYAGKHYSKDYLKNFMSQSPFYKTFLPKGGPHVSLSRRENEVLNFLPLAMTTKEIARELDISPRTVESHLQNIKFKLGCYRKSELVRSGKENLLIS